MCITTVDTAYRGYSSEVVFTGGFDRWRCEMTKMSEVAITECVLELRAACRRPVNQLALDTLLGWVRPDFERILDRTDGRTRWAQLGPRVRETGRHLGALADFFAS